MQPGETQGKGSEAERLEALIERGERGQLDFGHLRELARLYRSQSARLALLRAHGHDRDAVHYLNALCLRAHRHVYAPPPRVSLRDGFWVRRLPAALGRTLRIQLLASALLLLGALLGALLVLNDPDNLAVSVPAGMYDPGALRYLHDSVDAQRAFLVRHDQAFGINALFAGALFSNNTRVGLLSFAVGILGGVPTALLLLYNGLTLGAFATIFVGGPVTVDFLAWLIPHAIPELLAIVLCSAGGLALGCAVVAPGRAGVSRALRAAAADAMQLVLAAIPLFVIAAGIESFVRESSVSTAVRFTLAALSVVALLGYAGAVRHFASRQTRRDLSFLG